VIVNREKCVTCQELLTPVHVCSSKRLQKTEEESPSGAYHCSLGCDTRMKFPTPKHILNHLSSLHGVQPSYVSLNDQTWSTEVKLPSGDSLSECSECGILLNIKIISLAIHIMLECPARGAFQSVFINYIYDLAESQHMEPDLTTRYELIAQILTQSGEESSEIEDLDFLLNMELSSLYLHWSEGLGSVLGGFRDSQIEFMAELYARNFMSLTSEGLFRKKPVPISFDVKEVPSEDVLDRVSQELLEFDKENRPPRKASSLPEKQVLIRVAEELGKLE
ncbi:Uncharacterized protein FKW44_019639, partial [Caligus rogercresseyi]